VVDVDPARPPERRLRIQPGSPLVARTDEVGRIDLVIVQPETGELVGVVVRRGILLQRDVLVPIETVTAATEDGVRTRLSVEELNALPAFDGWRSDEVQSDLNRRSDPHPEAVPEALSNFDRGRLRSKRSGQVRTSSSGRPLRSGQLVKAVDGDVGRLDLVLIEPLSRRVEGLVVRQGRFLRRDTVILTGWVDEIHRDWIRLRVTRARIADLPEYRPDDEIGLDVLDRLWYDAPDLRPADLQYVEVHVRDGIVELTGHTSTEEIRARIVGVARTVRGVREVHDYLDTFESLAAAVRDASRRQAPSRVIPAGPGSVMQVTP
jgi:uncharacterized protein YrrD